MIEAGTLIGRYEINALIGTGGMGEVYRALDTELNRPVAIKFLSAEFTADPKRMKRFIQEARAASALNHPNIITVHEIGRLTEEDNAPRFFVTEFIDGLTLRERITVAKLKLAEILDITIQVASALVAAHAAGIVHRDIKPENIMVRHDGYVKVLDFGLAKPTERDAVDTEAATKNLVSTNPGTVMGTVAYMSPEQARGLAIDTRTDIWSLGAVLYEMVAGRQPFEGETTSHVIVNILEKEPTPLAIYAQDVPEALEWIVTETLTKDREERCQTARELHTKIRRLKQRMDVGAELERSVPPALSGSHDRLNDLVRVNYSGQQTSGAPARTTARSGEVAAAHKASSAEYIVTQVKRHKAATFVALGMLALIGLAFGIYKFMSRGKPQTTPQPMKVTRLTGDGKSFNAAMSPDGKYVANVFSDAGKERVLLRQTATATTRELVPPTDGHFVGLTFSRDGSYLYYVMGEKGATLNYLFRVSVLGGESRKLIADVDSAVSVSPDSQRLVYKRHAGKSNEEALFIANADGSNEQRIVVYKPPVYLADPEWSPDGKAIAFILSGTDEQGYYVNVNEVRVEDHAERKISSDRWRSITSIAWLTDGSGLVAAARDRASIAGSPQQLWRISYPNGETQRLTSDVNNYVNVSLSADSRSLVAVQQNTTSNIWVMPGVDVNRARQITSSNRAGIGGLSWTPDGKIIYMSVESENRDLWVMNADGSSQKQLTFDPGADESPFMTPDGRYIVFISNRGVGWGLWRMNADGSNAVELARNVLELSNPQCSSDSRWIVYSANSGGQNTLWKISIDGGTPTQITEEMLYGQAVSPDGKFIAYFHREPVIDSTLEIKIIPFEGGAPVKVLSPPLGVFNLQWTADSSALTYIENRDGVSNIWSLPLNGGPPKQLTDWKSDIILDYRWSRDGRQLAVTRGTFTNDLVMIEANLN